MAYSVFLEKGAYIYRSKQRVTGWGWKGPLELILSNPSAQAGTLTAGCPGLSPDNIWISPRRQTVQPLRATCASAWPPSQ